MGSALVPSSLWKSKALLRSPKVAEDLAQVEEAGQLAHVKHLADVCAAAAEQLR